MPNVNPAGSSSPPVSGSVEGPQQLGRAGTVSYTKTFPEDAPDLGRPDQQSGVHTGTVNCRPEQLATSEKNTFGDDELVHRQEVIKEISISSTTFIGPACRPQPAIEDELSEFYKELGQIDQPDTADGNVRGVSQFCPPPNTADGNVRGVSPFCPPPNTADGNIRGVSQFCPPPNIVAGNIRGVSPFCTRPNTADGNIRGVSQFFPPPDTADGNIRGVSQFCPPPDIVDGNIRGVSQFRAPSVNPPALKERQNEQRNPYRPYPVTRTVTDYRNMTQYRPRPDWSNPCSYQTQWQCPPPNFHFYPPPRPGHPTPPPYFQPQRLLYSQLENNGFRFGPDPRLVPSPSSAAYDALCDTFETPPYEEPYYQEVTQHQHSSAPSSVLVLMRGVPGSGKSTLARLISSSGPSGLTLSTDDYFYQEDGYHFDPALLASAHDWNQNRAKKAMLDGRTPVVIDNTNVQAWEMKPYVAAALDMGYGVKFVEPDTSWKCDPAELEKRNHHGVPRETIASMLDRFELPISVDIVMSSHEPAHKRKEQQSRPYRSRR